MPRKRFDDKTCRGPFVGFVFPSNIGRGEFLARNLGLGLVISLPLALLGGIAEQTQSALISIIYLILMTVFFLFGIWFSVIPRINDIGWSRKLAWLYLVPFVGLFFGLTLLVTPGK
jgi:uncharacterized membrane protein YhaH (DUF805 family)